MTAPDGNYVGVGLKKIKVYELNAYGVPKATSTTPYYGVQVRGAQSYEIKTPDARRISFKGDDTVLAQDVLPRQEPSTGTLKFAVDNHEAYAVLSATKRRVIGTMAAVGYGTDKQGYEPVVAVFGFQQGKNLDTGTRVWINRIVPSTQAIINAPSMTDGEMQYEVSLLPSSASHHVWGAPFTLADDGFTRSETNEYITNDSLDLCSWLADGVATKFSFGSGLNASSTDQISAIYTCAADGTMTDITATAAKAVDGITPAVKPDSGVMVICAYEHAVA